METDTALTFRCPECTHEQSIGSDPITLTYCRNCFMSLRVDQRVTPWDITTAKQAAEQLEADDIPELDTAEKVEAYYKQMVDNAVEDHQRKRAELDYDLEKHLRYLEDEKLATLRTLESLISPKKKRAIERLDY